MFQVLFGPKRKPYFLQAVHQLERLRAGEDYLRDERERERQTLTSKSVNEIMHLHFTLGGITYLINSFDYPNFLFFMHHLDVLLHVLPGFRSRKEFFLHFCKPSTTIIKP